MEYVASGGIAVGGSGVSWWRKFRPYQFAYILRSLVVKQKLDRVCVKRTIAPNYHDGIELHTWLDTLNRFWFEEELITVEEAEAIIDEMVA